MIITIELDDSGYTVDWDGNESGQEITDLLHQISIDLSHIIEHGQYAHEAPSELM